MGRLMPPHASRSERGYVQILDSGFAASLVDGVWYSKLLFSAQELWDDFYPVKDPEEVEALVSAARSALAVADPPLPGEPYAALIEPLGRLEHDLEGREADPILEEFRLVSRREHARLRLKRYPLSWEWVGLLWRIVLEDRLKELPGAKQ